MAAVMLTTAWAVGPVHAQCDPEQAAKLTAPDGAPGDSFGYSVSVDRNVAVVGAAYEESDAGSASVFRHDGTGWRQAAKLMAPDGSAGDNLGFSVSIDGDVAVAGARLGVCPADIDESGAVDFDDLLAVLDAWSGTVDFEDLLIVLNAWGPCA